MDPVGIEVKHQSEIFPKTEPEYQATHMKQPIISYSCFILGTSL